MSYWYSTAEYWRQYKRAQRAQGRCISCKSPAVDGKQRCERCYELVSGRELMRRRKAKAEGRCWRCGAPVYLDRTLCLKHILQRRERNKQAQAAKRRREGKPEAAFKVSEPLLKYLTKEEYQCLKQAKQQLKQLKNYLRNKQRPTVSPSASEA